MAERYFSLRSCVLTAALALLLLYSFPVACVQAAGTGIVTGEVHTKSSDRAMKIEGDKTLGVGGAVWDVGAAKHRFYTERADVWLISEQAELKKMPSPMVNAWYQQGKAPDYPGVYYQKTDKDAKYRFEKIPSGVYYLLTINPYGKPFDEGLKEREARAELYEKLPHPEEFELFVIGVRSSLVQKIVVHDGETTRVRLSTIKL